MTWLWKRCSEDWSHCGMAGKNIEEEVVRLQL